MKKFDFSKYIGTYSLEEAKEVTKKMAKEILDAKKKDAIETAKKIHGDKFTYKVRKGVSVDLTKLKSNQRVCATDLKGHHILLTEK